MTVTTTPNLQVIYVADAQNSKAFYQMLFNKAPVFDTPHYVAFPAGRDAIFSLWSRGGKPDLATTRYHEVGIMLPHNEAVDKIYAKWKAKFEMSIHEDIYTDVFGRTFVIKDPDGHLILVCPMD